MSNFFKFPECLDCANFQSEEICLECISGECFEPAGEELDFDSERDQ